MGRPRLKIPISDRIGQKIGSWTIIELTRNRRYIGKNPGPNFNKTTVSWFYNCKCNCGEFKEVFWGDLVSGKSKRCKSCANKLFLLNSQKGIQNFGKDNPNYRGSKDIPKRWLTRIKSNAKSRNLECLIDLKDLQNQWEKQKGLCFYTGLPLKFLREKETADTSKGISLTASLDRTNSSKGYTSDNITWVSKTVNLIKMDLSHDLFLKTCEMVFKHHIKKVSNG